MQAWHMQSCLGALANNCSCPTKLDCAVADDPSSSPEAAFRLSTAASLSDDSIQPHPSQRAALPLRRAFSATGSPVIITQDPRAAGQVVGTDPLGHVPTNVVVPLETRMFTGHICNVIRGCPGNPEAEFKGTRVQGKSIIQGMFKVPVAAKDVWVGQELLKPPLLPASFQRLVFTTAAKMFSSTYRVMVEGDGGEAVGYLNPLLAIAATVNVSLPGQQPDMREVQEDARLLDDRLADRAGVPASSTQRQRFFDRPANLELAVFNTQHVYTFIIKQSIVEMPTYKLRLGAFINLDLCPVLNGQPLQMMCKNMQSGEQIMSLLVWHKHLNYPPGRKHRDSDAGSSSCGSCRHSRSGSQDTTTSSSGLYSSSSICSSLYTNSSITSMSSDSTSTGDSSASDEACSECGAECESSSSECESDYHSCFDDRDAYQHCHGPDQQQGSAGAKAAGKQPQLLEPAFSAPPASLEYLAAGGCGFDPCDTLDQTPVQVTVIAAQSAAQQDASGQQAAAAAAAGGLSGAGSKPRSKRQTTGGKAVAAVAAAVRRMAAHLKGRRMPAGLRRNKSCPGTAL